MCTFEAGWYLDENGDVKVPALIRSRISAELGTHIVKRIEKGDQKEIIKRVIFRAVAVFF